jgi:putative alpha-1,2-mannosidase
MAILPHRQAIVWILRSEFTSILSSILVGIPLNNGVLAEATVTQHTALHRFTYQSGIEQLLFLLDVTGGTYLTS